MTKKFMFLIAIGNVMSAVTLFPQETTIKAGEGTLMLEKKNYPLKHALAYETTIDNEQATTEFQSRNYLIFQFLFSSFP